MGMFDEIDVFMPCPKCGKYQVFDAQTKDLDNCMWHFRALPADWYENELRKKFRTKLPIFPRYPLDRGANLWGDQAEQIEAEATLSEQYANQLAFVRVIASCRNCATYFRGKVTIKDNKLIGEIYDIEVDEG